MDRLSISTIACAGVRLENCTPIWPHIEGTQKRERAPPCDALSRLWALSLVPRGADVLDVRLKVFLFDLVDPAPAVVSKK